MAVLRISIWIRICRDPHHFFGKLDSDPDPRPHQSEKLDQDPDPHPHQCKKQDPDPHQSEKVEA
jgi:hypothetical protein